jgi:outer membrane lipoprotein-sorting protein
MNGVSTRIIVSVCFLLSASVASAQTVDDVIERSVKALGGRAALMKLKSRSTTGTITLSTPAGDVTGSFEVLNAAPNKMRTVIKADLTAIGAGPTTFDQRFNGTSGYVIDTLQGNREITGSHLDSLRNASFPHPFLNYKEIGIVAKLIGKEKSGDREAYVVDLEPTTGPVARHFIDAETYMPLKTSITVNVPQLGQDIEQTTEFSDYREVDGIKLPFRAKITSPVSNLTSIATKVEHNVPVDEKLFSKPGTPDLF